MNRYFLSFFIFVFGFLYFGQLNSVSAQDATCDSQIIISQVRDVIIDGETSEETCYYNNPYNCLDSTHEIKFEVSGLKFDGELIGIGKEILVGPTNGPYTNKPITTPGSISWSQTMSPSSSHIFTLRYRESNYNHIFQGACRFNEFAVSNTCPPESCDIVEPTSLGPDVFSLCDQIPENQPEEHQACLDCSQGGDNDQEGIWTAIGCIKKDPKLIIERFIKVGLGIGGGITLLTFLAAGFIYSTSEGSPEKVKNAKDMMTSALVGLIFIIFSVTILQFIGYSILKIPGFGG